MADENKEKLPEAQVPQAQPAQPAVSPEAQVKPKEEKKEEPKKEKPANCANCNKSIKNKRWYYRDGKYYCTKRCWKLTLKKEEAPKEASS